MCSDRGFPAATRRDQLIAGFVNIRSVQNKLDDLLDVRRDRLIDVVYSRSGTLHVAPSVSSGRNESTLQRHHHQHYC